MIKLFCLEMKLRWWVEKKWPALIPLLTWRRTAQGRNEPTHVLYILRQRQKPNSLKISFWDTAAPRSPQQHLSQLRAQLWVWQPRLTGERQQLWSSPVPANYPDSQGLLGDRGEGAAQAPGAAVISWCNEEWGKERSCAWCSAVLSAISCSEARQNNALLSHQ